MAKDPAFLFYPNNWMGGTMIMTRHQKGCYMDLLIAQFNNGPLSLETIKSVLGTDQAAWTVLSKKFKQDSDGNFFNEKLATEMKKRQKFTKAQKERIEKYWEGKKDTNECTTVNTTEYSTEVPISISNSNKDSTLFEKGVQGEKLSDHVIQKTIEFLKITGQRDLNEKEVLEYWKAFLIHSEGEAHANERDKIKHFRSWLKMQPNGKINRTSPKRNELPKTINAGF